VQLNYYDSRLAYLYTGYVSGAWTNTIATEEPSMKKITTALLLILLVFGSGCNNGAEPMPASEEPVEELTPSPTELLATVSSATEIPPSATETPPSTREEAPATEQASEHPAPDEARASPEPVALSPSLFPGSWADRDIYSSGLIPDETAVLDDLPGATVYHMKLDISDPTMVTGMMEARYTNQEDVALDELVLHLFAPSLGGVSISRIFASMVKRPIRKLTAARCV
jgi:hypothetical protein